MLCLWYIDSLHNRNKIHTYATFEEYFQIVYSKKCYAVSYLHIVQLAIENILSLSEMNHDTFINRKN